MRPRGPSRDTRLDEVRKNLEARSSIELEDELSHNPRTKQSPRTLDDAFKYQLGAAINRKEGSCKSNYLVTMKDGVTVIQYTLDDVSVTQNYTPKELPRYGNYFAA